MGILPLATGIEAPWTTPPILAGFISGGWQWALYQTILLGVSTAAYYPFILAADKQAYAQEQADGQLTAEELTDEIVEN
jgi:Phosphotransferase system cellobiose-specific component IIC